MLYSLTSGRVTICSRTASSATWRRSGTSLSSRRAFFTVAAARPQPYSAMDGVTVASWRRIIQTATPEPKSSAGCCIPAMSYRNAHHVRITQGSNPFLGQNHKTRFSFPTGFAALFGSHQTSSAVVKLHSSVPFASLAMFWPEVPQVPTRGWMRYKKQLRQQHSSSLVSPLSCDQWLVNACRGHTKSWNNTGWFGLICIPLLVWLFLVRHNINYSLFLLPLFFFIYFIAHEGPRLEGRQIETVLCQLLLSLIFRWKGVTGDRHFGPNENVGVWVV